MKPRHFTPLIACLGLSLLLVSGLSAPAAAQPEHVNLTRFTFATQTVELQKADGSISSAEFLFEAVLYPDGRANGGWGTWEHGTLDVLTLYRVVEGRVISDNRIGPFYTFTAKRLSPLSEDELTVILRPSPGSVPTGTVTFFIDGIAQAPLSFEARGRVLSLSAASFSFGYINAPPQTVVVQTHRGSYTANIENVALVFPSGGAIGLLALSGPDGEPQDFHVVAGDIQFRAGAAPTILLRAREADRDAAPGDDIIIIIRPGPEPFEPCRIYDIAGTNVGLVRFEAQSSITVFRD